MKHNRHPLRSCSLIAAVALVTQIAACGGGDQDVTSQSEFDTSQNPANVLSFEDPSPTLERPVQAGSTGQPASVAEGANEEAASMQAQAVSTAKIKVTSATQLNSIIVNTINARVSDYSFHKALIKSLVAGHLTVNTWQDIYGTGTINTPTGPKLCDGVCPSGSQFDDWLLYVLEVKTSYYEIVTPNTKKVPAIVSEIRQKYNISLPVMGQYMDAYYPAWSPNGPDIKLDWNQ